MMGPKKQGFWPRINILKENLCILWIQWITIRQKVPKSYFQSWFSMSKIDGIILIFFSLMNINLGDHFFLKTFFSNFNFWTILFSKIMPNFWWTVIPRIHKIQWFPLSMLIFGQKSCFLGPTIFEIPQPNWH